MEPEVLLSMYQESWDDFLEAYKSRVDQNEALVKLVEEYIDTVDGEGYATDAKKIKEKLDSILEI